MRVKKFLSKIFSGRSLVLFLLFVEVLGFILLFTFVGEYFAEIRAATSILSIILVPFIFNSKSNSAYKIAWLCLIAVFPSFGSICYILFANKKYTKRDKKKLRPTYVALKVANSNKESGNVLDKINQIEDSDAYYFGKYLNDYANNGIFTNTKVTYFPNGEDAFPVMLEELKKAKHYIFLEYFIIAEGIMWNSMLETIKQKIKEGVEVKMLYDDVGCLTTLPSNYFKKMRKLGIKCYATNRIRAIFDIRNNNRDHRKILIIDGHTGFTGGINIADEYINEKERFGYWKDNSIMLKGDGVFGLTSLFLSTFMRIDKHDPTIDEFKKYYPSLYASEKETFPFERGYVAPYGSLPFTYENVAENVYLSMINKAKRSIDITTPYLILDELLENALINAAKSGIIVRIITPHIPDKRMVFEITRSYYKNLIEAGVKIYEFTPGFIHAKTLVVDDDKAIVGTINFDYRSLFLHSENAVFMYKVDCIKDIKKDLENTIHQSKEITLEMALSSPLYKRLLRFLLRLFASAL